MSIENELSLKQARSSPRSALTPCNDCTVGEPASCGKQKGAVDSGKRLVVLCSVKGLVKRVGDVGYEETITNVESMLVGVDFHPEVAQAVAILSGAKKEAENLIRGEDQVSVERRLALQSSLIKDLIERSGLGVNGQSSADNEISTTAEATLQGN